MTIAVSSTIRSRAGASARPVAAETFDLLLPALCVCLAIRIFIPFEVLALFEHYTSLGGSIFEKIHPGAYLLFVLSGFALTTRSRQRTVGDRAIARGSWIFLAAIVVVGVLGLATGRTQGLSYLLDSLALGPLVCLTMTRLSDRNKYRVMAFVLVCLILNASVLFPEFLTKSRLFPYDIPEMTFRPTAFLGHPLANGLASATAISFLWATDWKFPSKIGLTLFLVAACFVSQARMASIFSVLAALSCTWIYLTQSVRKKVIDEGTLVLAAVVTLGIILTVLVVIVASGFADRLIELGLFNDASSQSRFIVYSIFGYMTRNQLLFGMPRVLAEYYLTQSLKLISSESSVVDFVVEFGIVGTTVTIIGLLNFLRQLAVASKSIYVWIGVFVFMAVAATNNTLSGKGPQAAIIAALAVGAMGAMQSRAYLSARSRVAQGAVGNRAAAGVAH
jgi:hypothetical protein